MSYRLSEAPGGLPRGRPYRTPYRGDEDNVEEEPERDAIIGPTTTAFPLNDGWHPAEQSPRTATRPRRLSDLTIHEITARLTKRITDGVRPNCDMLGLQTSKFRLRRT